MLHRRSAHIKAILYYNRLRYLDARLSHRLLRLLMLYFLNQCSVILGVTASPLSVRRDLSSSSGHEVIRPASLHFVLVVLRQCCQGCLHGGVHDMLLGDKV